MDRTGGISIVGEEEVTMEEEIGKGDREGKFDLLSKGVCSGYQSVVCSVERMREVHSGVVMFKGRVAGDERQEDRVGMEVREGELMMFGE